MKKNKIRTLLLSEALLKKLDVLHDNYYVDKSTFIRMAIYHGLENIKNGYYPYRNMHIKEMHRKKYKVTLPEETWEKLELVKENIKYIPYDETPDITMNEIQNIPCGELVEMFVRMEIKAYMEFTNIFLKDDEVDDLELFNENKELTFSVKVPMIFYNKLEDIQNRTGLGEKKVYRYLVNNALFDECYKTNVKAIDTDADLIRYIDILGLNRYKAITLIKTLVQSNKILFLNDNNMNE